MFCVYDLCQLTPLNYLFINPHVDHRVEAVGRFDIVPDDFGDGRTPEGEERRNISFFTMLKLAHNQNQQLFLYHFIFCKTLSINLNLHLGKNVNRTLRRKGVWSQVRVKWTHFNFNEDFLVVFFKSNDSMSVVNLIGTTTSPADPKEIHLLACFMINKEHHTDSFKTCRKHKQELPVSWANDANLLSGHSGGVRCDCCSGVKLLLLLGENFLLRPADERPPPADRNYGGTMSTTGTSTSEEPPNTPKHHAEVELYDLCHVSMNASIYCLYIWIIFIYFWVITQTRKLVSRHTSFLLQRTSGYLGFQNKLRSVLWINT